MKEGAESRRCTHHASFGSTGEEEALGGVALSLGGVVLGPQQRKHLSRVGPQRGLGRAAASGEGRGRERAGIPPASSSPPARSTSSLSQPASVPRASRRWHGDRAMML